MGARIRSTVLVIAAIALAACNAPTVSPVPERHLHVWLIQTNLTEPVDVSVIPTDDAGNLTGTMAVYHVPAAPPNQTLVVSYAANQDPACDARQTTLFAEASHERRDQGGGARQHIYCEDSVQLFVAHAAYGPHEVEIEILPAFPACNNPAADRDHGCRPPPTTGIAPPD